MMIDSYGRRINYLRLAVTDRCNLRCTYCMPEKGLDWLDHKELMSYEEMLRISTLLVKMGIEKIRVTGGEPFIRKDLLSFLKDLSLTNGLHELTLTTNGLLCAPLVGELKSIGIKSVNLSLDTLDKDRFIRMARRDGLDQVLRTLDGLLANDVTVKINTVVMENCNIEDIVPLVRLTEILPVSVRFIEEMPFNGGTHNVSLTWDYMRILEHIKAYFPGLRKIADAPHSTSYNYRIDGHKGDVGIIAAYSRSFCGSCNRLRITPTGVLRTCLYDGGKVNLKDAIRNGCSDTVLKAMVMDAIANKAADGWEAQNILVAQKLEHQSMATIGG